MYKNLLSILVGLFSSFLIILLLEMTLPLPFGIHSPYNGTPTMEEYIKTLPQALLLLFVLMYGVAALFGSYISVLISGTIESGLRTTVMLLLVVLANFISIHSPFWIIILSCATSLFGGFAGTRWKTKTT